MSTFTWLHLSDLHFRESDTYDANIVLKTLLRDIPKLVHESGLQPDLIAITGDIAFSGKPREYELARLFLDDLLQVTGVGKDRLFVVPGNHDVDRAAISPLAERAVETSRNGDASNMLLADDRGHAYLLQRLHNYREFVNDYFSEYLSFDDEHRFYVKLIDVSNLRVAILGLNSAWASKSDEDYHSLLLGERQVRTALEMANGTDIRIALMHHPFDWLLESDRAEVEPLLSRECDFILHGHMNKAELLQTKTPTHKAMVIAAGVCYKTRLYPSSYNFVRLDLAAGKGAVFLRMYTDRHGGFWTRDVINYTNVPDGEFWFDFPRHTRPTREPLSTLRAWLVKHGLRGNPFASWNAAMEGERDLSGYFIDVGGLFDELLAARNPCVVLAARGCGKTAYRQMVAAQCQPFNRDSQRLAITYTYTSFERVLADAEGDFSRVEPRHHVAELLRQGLSTLKAVARQDTAVKEALRQQHIAARLAAYQARYTPHSASDSITEAVADLGNLSALESLTGFTSLLKDARLQSCVVLVDEVDECSWTAGKPLNQVALLAPLLGTLPLIECPGFRFKFFLPQELSPVLDAQEWFRPARLRSFIIKWDDDALQQLVSQRLAFFSARWDRVYDQLGQLCKGDLATFIDYELVRLAEGRPRWALVLANMLLKTHCRTPKPQALIALPTWESVKSEWPQKRDDLLLDEQNLTEPEYKVGLKALRARIMDSRCPAKIAEFAPLEVRLLRNLQASSRHGDIKYTIGSRLEIVDELDRLALETVGDTFTHIARTSPSSQDMRTARLLREGRRKGIPEIFDKG